MRTHLAAFTTPIKQRDILCHVCIYHPVKTVFFHA